MYFETRINKTLYKLEFSIFTQQQLHVLVTQHKKTRGLSHRGSKLQRFKTAYCTEKRAIYSTYTIYIHTVVYHSHCRNFTIFLKIINGKLAYCRILCPPVFSDQATNPELDNGHAPSKNHARSMARNGRMSTSAKNQTVKGRKYKMLALPDDCGEQELVVGLEGGQHRLSQHQVGQNPASKDHYNNDDIECRLC